MTNKQFNNLKILQIGNNNIWALCPYHNDTNRPNLSISIVDKYYGHYKCWACPAEGWLSESQKQSLRTDIMSKKYNKPYNPIDWVALNNVYRDCYIGLYPDIPFNVNRQTLWQLRCGWCIENNAYTFPFRNENNEIIGIQLRYPDGSKCCIEGSRLGLFIPQGIDWSKQDTIFITEGVSDLATLLDMEFIGIGRPSANSCEDLITAFHTNCAEEVNYWIMTDGDAVGCKAAINLKYKMRYFGLVTNIIYPNKYKDLREWVSIEGKDKVKEVLESLI